MKRYSILMVVALMVLAVAWTAFGQREGQPTERPRFGPQMSEEERAKMRERFQNMSAEEKEKFRTQMRERFAAAGAMFGPEAQLEAIKTIEEQLAKLKEALKTQPRTEGFANLSEEEKTQLREKFTKAREERQAAIRTIIAQIARLQGPRPPIAEGEQLIIVSTADLKTVRELAVKEKAKETEDRLTALVEAGQRGFGFGRFPFPGGPPGQPGERGTRPGPRRGASAPGGGAG